MAGDYDYANARLRAMKSRLLARGDYAALLDESTVEGVVAWLTHTTYQAAVEAALMRASGWECLSQALRRHLASALSRVTGYFADEPKRLWRILIGRWEVFNVKTILRGLALAIPADEILGSLVPTGELGESDLNRLAAQTSVRATVDLLATWNHVFGPPLVSAMPRYAESQDLAELELSLDRARYALAFKALREMGDTNAEMVRGCLVRQIDAANILTVLRLSEWGNSALRLSERFGSSAPAALLLKGSGVPTQRLRAYEQVPAVDQIVRDMDGTEFHAPLERGHARYSDRRSLTVFEDEIEAHLARKDIARFEGDSLTIGIAIAYLAALINEIRNLRMIGRGIAAGWPRRDIERELWLWPS
jgi:V/A-type H+-transporting ATPase subunit C